MKWEYGRQGTGYFKKKLAEGSWWDLWLLKYPAGTSIPPHVDRVDGKQHFRLNVVLKGEQTFGGEVILKFGPIVLFRPDTMRHWVRKVTKERLVLSLGWVR